MSTSKCYVHFKFNQGTSDQDRIAGLVKISKLTGVFNVDAMSPFTDSPVFRLKHFAEIIDGADINNIVDTIKDYPNIEYANIFPVQRPF